MFREAPHFSSTTHHNFSSVVNSKDLRIGVYKASQQDL